MEFLWYSQFDISFLATHASSTHRSGVSCCVQIFCLKTCCSLFRTVQRFDVACQRTASSAACKSCGKGLKGWCSSKSHFVSSWWWVIVVLEAGLFLARHASLTGHICAEYLGALATKTDNLSAVYASVFFDMARKTFDMNISMAELPCRWSW